MRKLTKVSIALVLGLLVSLSMFGAGAFARSANQSLASCSSGRLNGQQQWGNGSKDGACNGGGCQFSGCNNDNQCATELQSFKSLQEVREVEQVRVAVVHREVLSFRALRFIRQLVTIRSNGRFLHVWRAVQVWQVEHAVRLVRSFQTHSVVREIKKLVVSQHAVRVCHQF